MRLDEVLPAVDAGLNATSFVLLVTGRLRIARGDVPGHRRAMLAALWVSAAFLAVYLVHHALHGSHPFPEVGAWRTVYLAILVPHTTLAIATACVVPRVVFLALKGRFVEHRRIARIVFPVWVFVSASGVVVYLMLYHLGPALAAP